MAWLGKIRPQILIAIVTLGVISAMAIMQEGEQYIAIATGCTSGIVALGLKLLDGENE